MSEGKLNNEHRFGSNNKNNTNSSFKLDKTRGKREKNEIVKWAKRSTAPGIPRRSPIQVLTGLDVA